MRAKLGLLLILGAVVVTVQPVAASQYVAPVDEIPLTSLRPTGARSLGMGGVGLAVLDDASAIIVNPAALARMRRIEVGAGLSRAVDDVSGSAFGEGFDSSLSRTRLSTLRFAYPFPTFRGSLVLGLSRERIFDFGTDFIADGYRREIEWDEPGSDDPETGPWGQREDYTADGGVTAWSLGCAFDASPGISLGASASYWTGSIETRYLWGSYDDDELSPSYDSLTLDVVSEADISGVRAKLGGLFYLTDRVAMGVVIESPVAVRLDGVTETSYRWTGTSTGRVDTTVYFVDEVTLPFSFGAGVAYTPTDFVMIGADVVFTDWSEIDYAGRVWLDDPAERRAAYEATTEIRAGVEFIVPSLPLRLRAGYMSSPLAYRGYDIDSDRSYFTLGAGVLIDTVLALDAAFVTGGFERSRDETDYTVQQDETLVVLEAHYRF